MLHYQNLTNLVKGTGSQDLVCNEALLSILTESFSLESVMSVIYDGYCILTALSILDEIKKKSCTTESN